MLAGDAGAANAALAALIDAGFPLADFCMGAPSLDEVFFALTGKAEIAAPQPAAPQSATAKALS